MLTYRITCWSKFHSETRQRIYLVSLRILLKARMCMIVTSIFQLCIIQHFAPCFHICRHQLLWMSLLGRCFHLSGFIRIAQKRPSTDLVDVFAVNYLSHVDWFGWSSHYSLTSAFCSVTVQRRTYVTEMIISLQGRRPLPKSGGAQGGECGPACKHARSGIAFQKW